MKVWRAFLGPGTQTSSPHHAAWSPVGGCHGGFAFLDGIGTTYEPPAVPEPSTFILLGAGLGGLALWRRKQRK
ncbi:PEP-CTERM sorting domain-containing protein [Geomonas silvestris]|uniref:PEP-CTERM sorting domain-containing protein n=1 Tax=Geomonas silvestris TaxID=2740184 RepID=UPI001FEA80E7|nr:PEP-CTERM sorting domain-containing protein [Geomonas silvestris]